jgi:manganese transport protein
MWFSQIINSLLLPVVLIFMLQLINRDDLMGRYKNNRFTNVAAYSGTFILIVLNLILIVQTIQEMLGKR